MIKTLLLLPGILLIMAACTREMMPRDGFPTPEKSVKLTYTLMPSALTASTSYSLTRSDCMTEAEASEGKAFRLAVYTAGRLVASGPAPLEVTLLSENHYDYYAWTATSLGLDAAPAMESDLTAWESVYTGLGGVSGDGKEALSAYIDTYGMPMAGRKIACRPGELSDGMGHLVVPVERLFAKIRLTISYDETLTGLLPERSVSAVRVHNWAYACHPFSRQFDKTKVHASALDMSSSMEADGTYTLYLPENLQGVRSDGGDTLRCSFLSVQAHFEDGYGSGIGYGGGVGDALYRFFPHSEDGSRYDIDRNREYDILLSLSYDGRFITGEWKETGDTRERRQIRFNTQQSQRLTGAGTTLYMTLSYHYDDSGNLITDYFNRFNGVAVGTASETADWTAAGTVPPNTRLARVGVVQCKACGREYWGYPYESSARLTWAQGAFFYSKRVYYCMDCNAVLIPDNLTARNRFQQDRPSSTDPYLITSPDWRIAYDVPAGIAEGTVVDLHAVTRDGRISVPYRFTVGNHSTLMFDQSLTGTQYVAEKIRFTPVSLPADITALTYSVTAGSSCILSEAVPGEPLARSFSFLNPGSVSIEVRDQNGTLRQSLERTVVRPGLRFLDESGTAVSEYALEVNGTQFHPRWSYVRQDGSPYIDYDPDLYASCLGDAVLSVSGVWTEESDGDVYICRTSHPSLGTLPYLSSSVGTLTARCPRNGAIFTEANLKAVNPFTGWPETIKFNVFFTAGEASKKVPSLPVYYDKTFSLVGKSGVKLPLTSRCIVGDPPLSYSSYDAMEGNDMIVPTVRNANANCYYYARVHNSHSNTDLTRDYLHLVVTVNP